VQDNADTAPETLLAARLSMPFNIALVVQHGDVWAGDLPEVELANSAIRAMLPKIRLVADPGMSRRGAAISVRCKDGTTVKETIRDPRGSEGNPLTWDEVVTKFRRLTTDAVDRWAQDGVVAAVEQIDRIDGVQLATALRLAAGGTMD
jgi:2-methylcitrate dehydratase PrpD